MIDEEKFFEYEEFSFLEVIRELKNKLIEYEFLTAEEKTKRKELEHELIALCETLIVLLEDTGDSDDIESRIL